VSVGTASQREMDDKHTDHVDDPACRLPKSKREGLLDQAVKEYQQEHSKDEGHR